MSSLHIGEKGGITWALIHYFEVWALRLIGLFPGYRTCSKCGKCVKDSGFYAWLDAGQGRCAECADGRGLHIRAATARALYEISKMSPEEFAARPLDAGACGDLERLIKKHFEWQLEKRFKSYPALREMMNGSEG